MTGDGVTGGRDRQPVAAALRADRLSVGYRPGQPVTENLDLDLPQGRVSAIIGPNGCGKSTLLRALARLLAPQTGQVLLDGEPLHRLPTRTVARRLGLLPQGAVTPAGLTVRELVRRGRIPYTSPWRQWSPADEAAVQEALVATGLTGLAEAPVDTLSGGQRQRAWLALVVAQQTRVLLLDEPTTYLDLAHQLDVLDLVRDLNARHGSTVVMVLHDINQAARYATHIVAMKDGRVLAQGTPAQVVTRRLMEEVFEVTCQVVDGADGVPFVVPLARASAP
ncbi:MAG: ABC transporter ATP-binding protein [Actinomycetota bacterium]